MFTRQLFVAAALMAATYSAQADVISVSSGASLAANMSIVDANSSLTADSLASIASSSADSSLSLVRGVEGLYMVAARAADVAAITAPASSSDAVTIGAPAATTPTSTDAIIIGAVGPDATAVPEPSSIALLVAGMLGFAGFKRGRKQG